MSDVHADRYFRFMLGALGVPLFKRWIIWTAVALRSRWMAGGIKRLSIAVWGLLAVVGLASFCAGIASYVVDADTVLGISRATLLITAAVMPLLCGFLWGHQFAAAIVAALGGAVDPAADHLRRGRLRGLLDGGSGRPTLHHLTILRFGSLGRHPGDARSYALRAPLSAGEEQA